MLIMSKTKVTPVRAVIIPRLELVGALVSVRVSIFLRNELSIGDYDEYFWTDSRAVLGYVHNETKRFHVFVAKSANTLNLNSGGTLNRRTTQRTWRPVERLLKS